MSWLDMDPPEEDVPKERGNFKLTPKELDIRPVFPAEWKQLSNEELCALAQGGNELAMNTLIWRNESFLAEQARAVHEKSFSKVREYSVDFDDLMQAARIGFWKAINTFKPSRGTKLITYGGKCIENELKDFKGKYKRATKTERRGYRMEDGDQEGEDSNGFNLELRPDEYKKRPEPMALALIEEVLRFGETDIGKRYLDVIRETAKDYAAGIMRRLREHEYNPELMRLYVVGGGGCLIRNFADYDPERVTINDDICATAKGYELLAQRRLEERT